MKATSQTALIALLTILALFVIDNLLHFIDESLVISLATNEKPPASAVSIKAGTTNLFSYRESLSKCNDKRSELFDLPRPFRIFIHPKGADVVLSESISGNVKNPDKMFETHIRKPMLEALAAAPSSDSPLIFDIGANIGLHTMFFLGDGYTVHAFEPLQVNTELLECSIMQSGFEQQIVLNKFALSDSIGSSCMTSQDTNIGHSFINSSLSTSSCPKNKMIATQRLDDYLNNNISTGTVPFLIKIDIEGHEFKALRTATGYFKKYGAPRHIFSEFAPEFIRDAGTNPEDYLQLLYRDFGMKINCNGQSVEPGSSMWTELIRPGNTGMYDIHAENHAGNVESGASRSRH